MRLSPFVRLGDKGEDCGAAEDQGLCPGRADMQAEIQALGGKIGQLRMEGSRESNQLERLKVSIQQVKLLSQLVLGLLPLLSDLPIPRVSLPLLHHARPAEDQPIPDLPARYSLPVRGHSRAWHPAGHPATLGWGWQETPPPSSRPCSSHCLGCGAQQLELQQKL